MFVEKVKSPGIAHLSYLFGSDGQAAVVDPRRDCDLYIELAARNGCRITHILETHRNEDLVSGAPVLAARTGAVVYHGPRPAAPIAYAQTVTEGERFEIGKVGVHVLETPGHTDDSLSFAIADTDYGEEPVGVFTGDALFIGDVGRTDFYPDRAREVAGLLYDSLQKLLALGGQTVLYPAHGAGSVCGSSMADREISTLGYEQRHNPRLQIHDREAFIEAKLAEHHEMPPYFKRMEELNATGADAAEQALRPPPLTRAMLNTLKSEVSFVDVRSPAAFLGAHLPGSLSIPADMIGAFAGWLIQADEELVLIAENETQAAAAARHLYRIGYDRLRGYMQPSLPAWAAQGERFGTMPVVGSAVVKDRVEKAPADWQLLDVRGADEVEQGRVPGARHIYAGHLPSQLGQLRRDRRYTVMCGSGARATVAASVLARAGFDKVDLFLGSMGAWKSEALQVEEPA